MLGRYDMPEGVQCPNGAYFGFIITPLRKRVEAYARIQFRLPAKPQLRRDFYHDDHTMQSRYFCVMFAKLLPKEHRKCWPRFYVRVFWARPEEMWA